MHTEPEGARPSYRFGSFRLSPAERAFTHRDVAVALPPQLYELLLLLVREEGRLVPREHIVEVIWPDVLVSDANLRQRIWHLRRALRSLDAEDRDWIETVPRRGYRFVHPVTVDPEARPIAADLPLETASAPRRRWPALRLAVILSTAGLLASDRGPPDRALPVRTSETRAIMTDPTRQAVAILRLRTHSGDPDDGWIADAFTEMLRAEL